MNMSDPSDSEKDCTDSESDSSSECLNVSLEGYTSSIDNTSDDSREDADDTEVEDDKSTIFKFYKELTVKLLKTFSIEILDLNLSLEHLKSNYRRVSHGTLPTQIDFTNKSHCIAYLFRYAACHTALVFDAVSKIFDSSSYNVLSKVNKKSLNVVFLGGGPGNDFVGFLIALYGHHHHLFDLDVTIVDKMSGWEDMFKETIESLRKGDGGKASSIFEEMNITTTFISADLNDFEEWDEIMHAKLENADMVFFVKVLSHIPDDDNLRVLVSVIACMEVESLLIYIDYPYPDRMFASLRSYLTPVYGSWKTKYTFNHKGYNTIDSCSAAVKVFERCENN